MYVRVEVYPQSKKEVVKETGENRYEISVKEPAERNLANHRIREIVAKCYGVEKNSVRIISGHQSGRKILSVNSE